MSDSGDSGDFLAAMSASSHQRVSLARSQLGDEEIQARALDTPAPPRLKLSARRFDVIAEVKFRSPAAGQLRAGSEEQVNARVAGYAEAGAAVVSVLTEPSHFDGSLSHLKTAVRALEGRIPAMRKDFLVDPYQVYESRAMGADAILLIAACLDDHQMKDMEAIAQGLYMSVLVEVHDAAELERALALKTPLIGVNNRNLRTFETSLETTLALVGKLPSARLLITESGIQNREDVLRIRAAGVHAFLVGEAFMRADDPGAALAALFA